MSLDTHQLTAMFFKSSVAYGFLACCRKKGRGGRERAAEVKSFEESIAGWVMFYLFIFFNIIFVFCVQSKLRHNRHSVSC